MVQTRLIHKCSSLESVIWQRQFYGESAARNRIQSLKIVEADYRHGSFLVCVRYYFYVCAFEEILALTILNKQQLK